MFSSINLTKNWKEMLVTTLNDFGSNFRHKRLNCILQFNFLLYYIHVGVFIAITMKFISGKQ